MKKQILITYPNTEERMKNSINLSYAMFQLVLRMFILETKYIESQI